MQMQNARRLRFEGKTVLLTGGAGEIGSAIARVLADEGASLVVADIDVGAAQELATTLPGRAVAAELDVTCDYDWRRIVARIIEQFDGLHVLVNNAGLATLKASQNPVEFDLDEWRRIMAVNVEGTVLGCRHAIPAMAESGGGSIVNVSSIAALRPTPQLYAYGAAKAAVAQLSKSVAQYCADRGHAIRCNSVHPGLIDTAMFHGAFTPGKANQRIAAVPLRRLGNVDEVARAVAYLASDDSSYVTGAQLVVDGGVTM
jgi:NAD(P)-dependent dehydrogenase (short-subunit alcohol dehydrogenase family)